MQAHSPNIVLMPADWPVDRARREGLRDDLPPAMTGSHIDTQPTGVKFDGDYGVLAGLEVLSTLAEANVQTIAPFEAAVWTNQEGSLFVPVMMNSGVSVRDALAEIGYADEHREPHAVGAYRSNPPAKGARSSANNPIDIEQVVYFPPQPFAAQWVAEVGQSAKRLGVSSMDLISGAGHDAVNSARVVPAAMIFAPCKDGISHNEIEDARVDHLEAGCNVPPQVMLNAASNAGSVRA